MFTKGQIYRRRKIHELFGGQQQGGISTPSNHNMIFLFTSERGEEHGYSDGWKGQDVFYYTGEGQVGDMTFTRGNKAIRDHEENGKDLHLFQQSSVGHVEYIGQFRYQSHDFRDGPDSGGQIRKQIIFELVRIK
jgi:5-methylcytosine-specific restriction enzyme A